MEILKNWQKKLESISTIEYRKKGSLYCGGPYIVGYHSSADISFRISYEKQTQTSYNIFPDGFLFYIEHKGSTILNCRIKLDECEQGFKSYLYILEEIVEQDKLMSKRLRKFPEMIKEDKRDDIINKLIDDINQEI